MLLTCALMIFDVLSLGRSSLSSIPEASPKSKSSSALSSMESICARPGNAQSLKVKCCDVPVEFHAFSLFPHNGCHRFCYSWGLGMQNLQEINPDEAVAYGAAVQAAIVSGTGIFWLRQTIAAPAIGFRLFTNFCARQGQKKSKICFSWM